MDKIEIEPVKWSKKSTPKESREYTIVGGNGACGTLSEIREWVYSNYGTQAVIVGRTLEGEKIQEEFK